MFYSPIFFFHFSDFFPILPQILESLYILEPFFLTLTFIDCCFYSTDLILYIVVCTYKSVVGLGHNSTKPVEFCPEWVQQWRKEKKGRLTIRLPFPKKHHHPQIKSHPKLWIQKRQTWTELLISSIPSFRYFLKSILEYKLLTFKRQFYVSNSQLLSNYA